MQTRYTVLAVVLLSALIGAVALAGAGAAAAQSSSADVAFDDQVGVGNVTVSAATLPDGGYVAVYNASGGLVGTSEYLDAGTHENVTVTVSPALSRSQVVVAETRTDDGDRSFNASADTPYLTDGGSAVSDTAYVADEPFDRGTATPADAVTETSTPGFTAGAALLALVALAGVGAAARRRG